MAISFDPRSAIVYFDLCFALYDYEEDVGCVKTDPDAAERVRLLLAAGKGDAAEGAANLECKALDEAQEFVRKAIPGRTVSNEGHDSFDNLVMKVGVNTLAEARSLADVVNRAHGGGDDECYLDTAYFSLQGFRLYPNGVNGGSIALHELEDAIEDGRITAPVEAA